MSRIERLAGAAICLAGIVLMGVAGRTQASSISNPSGASNPSAPLVLSLTANNNTTTLDVTKTATTEQSSGVPLHVTTNSNLDLGAVLISGGNDIITSDTGEDLALACDRFSGGYLSLHPGTPTQLRAAGSSVALGAPSNAFARLYLDFTNTATVGDVTINKAAGRVNLGAGGGSLTVTDSIVTTATHVFLNADSAPGNVVAVQFFAVAGTGSFTVNAVPVVTNQTAIDFLIVNAN